MCGSRVRKASEHDLYAIDARRSVFGITSALLRMRWTGQVQKEYVIMLLKRQMREYNLPPSMKYKA
jgi:hypothetical protein